MTAASIIVWTGGWRDSGGRGWGMRDYCVESPNGIHSTSLSYFFDFLKITFFCLFNFKICVSEWSLHVLPVCVWVSSGCSGFPHNGKTCILGLIPICVPDQTHQ